MCSIGLSRKVAFLARNLILWFILVRASLFPMYSDSLLSACHPFTFWRSSLTVFWTTVLSLSVTSKTESSAYRKHRKSRLLLSHLYIIKSIEAPGYYPGVPHIPWILTWLVLKVSHQHQPFEYSYRYYWTQFRVSPLKPIILNFIINILWSAVSNAFCKSSMTIPQNFPPSPLLIRSVRCSKYVSVEYFFLKSDCSSYKGYCLKYIHLSVPV